MGSALLDHVEQLAREEGLETIWLTTPEEHPNLPSLYRNRGSRTTSDYPLEYRAYDEAVMEKPLDDC